MGENSGQVVHRGMEGRSLCLAEHQIGCGAEDRARGLTESTGPAERAWKTSALPRSLLRGVTPNIQSLNSQICVTVFTWGSAPQIPFALISGIQYFDISQDILRLFQGNS